MYKYRGKEFFPTFDYAGLAYKRTDSEETYTSEKALKEDVDKLVDSKVSGKTMYILRENALIAASAQSINEQCNTVYLSNRWFSYKEIYEKIPDDIINYVLAKSNTHKAVTDSLNQYKTHIKSQLHTIEKEMKKALQPYRLKL